MHVISSTFYFTVYIIVFVAAKRDRVSVFFEFHSLLLELFDSITAIRVIRA